jgi:hypothetical protein
MRFIILSIGASLQIPNLVISSTSKTSSKILKHCFIFIFISSYSFDFTKYIAISNSFAKISILDLNNKFEFAIFSVPNVIFTKNLYHFLNFN